MMFFFLLSSASQTLHLWNIYQHLPWNEPNVGKKNYHTWSIWDQKATVLMFFCQCLARSKPSRTDLKRIQNLPHHDDWGAVILHLWSATVVGNVSQETMSILRGTFELFKIGSFWKSLVWEQRQISRVISAITWNLSCVAISMYFPRAFPILSDFPIQIFTGWWFGTFFIFPYISYIGNFLIPIDEL